MQDVEVVVYSKPGCCLCDDLKADLDGLRARHPFYLREINILADQRAYEKFKNDIPVVLVNGKKVMGYRFDEQALLKALRRAQTRRPKS